jgi:hypothetical protein
MSLIEKVKDIDEHWKVIISSLFLISVFGVLPSIYFIDWSWFARSGALLVCLGLYVAWLDYKGKTDRDISKTRSMLRAQESKILDEFNERTKIYFNRIEFLVVIFGTLIWGYGDLAGKLYS